MVSYVLEVRPAECEVKAIVPSNLFPKSSPAQIQIKRGIALGPPSSDSPSHLSTVFPAPLTVGTKLGLD